MRGEEGGGGEIYNYHNNGIGQIRIHHTEGIQIQTRTRMEVHRRKPTQKPLAFPVEFIYSLKKVCFYVLVNAVPVVGYPG